jgi:uncharacterized membrane protein
MPRRNKLKKEPTTHTATVYDKNFNQRCYGCAFAGKNFVCLTSGSVCLKTNTEKTEGGENGAVERRTD